MVRRNLSSKKSSRGKAAGLTMKRGRDYSASQSKRRKTGLISRLKGRIGKRTRRQGYQSRKSKLMLRSGLQKGVVSLFIVLALLIIGGAGYSGIQTVIRIRASKAEQDILGSFDSKKSVIGFSKLPIYPNSEFIFSSSKENPSVQEFLTSGKAIYRLPPNRTFAEVSQFYSEVLPLLEWEHVLSVPRSSTDKKFGEYWMRKDQSEAVRIYNEINDIWYEKVTIEQASSGLSDLVQKEIERELTLASSSGAELLPDFPWKLTVPKEYLVSYYSAQNPELKAAMFQKLGGVESVILEPVGPADSTPYDAYLERFLQYHYDKEMQNFNDEMKLAEGEPQLIELTPPIRWEILNSIYTEVNGRTVLECTITNHDINAKAYIFASIRDKNVYIVTSFSEDSPFSQFILQNISDKQSTLTNKDLELKPL